jgi:hydroxymethylpyrimidine/phosphomethylpyrimidine kinase
MTRSLVSIAGYDPSGGAGVLLDIAVFEGLGFRGFGILSSVTAQNPGRVSSVTALPARLLASQHRALVEAFEISGYKVGMLGSAANLAATARILAGNPRVPRVVDPVLRASSGAVLLEKGAWPRLLPLFRKKATLITPNLEESFALTGFPVRTVEDMKEAAREIHRAALIPCLVKGGHLSGRPVDVLFDGEGFRTFEHSRVRGDVHGTGCFLSSVILAFLARGRPLEEACARGIEAASRAIRTAARAGGGTMLRASIPSRRSPKARDPRPRR